MKGPRRLALAVSRDSCACARISPTLRACRGAATPPIVMVAATGPFAVCTTSSRTAARNRSAAIARSSGLQFLSTTPNLFEEKRPSMSPARMRLRRRRPPAAAPPPALGGVVGAAVLDHHAELVRGKAAEHVACAHAAAQAPPDRRDHLVGDAEPIGLVDARQIADRDHHEAA